MRPRPIADDRAEPPAAAPPAGTSPVTTPSAAKSVAAPLRAVPRSPLPAATTVELWAAVHLPGLGSAEQLERLASCVQRFTPRVSRAPPDGLLLEVKGSLHLFAGVPGLSRELTAECRHFHARPVVAFAPTPLAALAAARACKPCVITDPVRLTGQLAPLPLSVLRWPEETLARLARLGVRTIGAVLRLPRAGFARRFGAAQLTVLDELTGRTPDVRVAFHPRERFRRRRDLDCELEDHGLLRAALAPLFTALGAFLTARQCGVTQLECLLVHRQRQVTRCALSLALPCADGQRLGALFGERLSTVRLPAAVRACELRADELVPQRLQSHCLWQPGEHGGTAEAATGGLIERLRARLGPDAVQGLALRAGHRPEKAWTITGPPSAAVRTAAVGYNTAPGHATSRAAPSSHAVDVMALAARRPLWILPTPRPLAVQHGLPRHRGPLRLVSEAERIETGWWDGEEIARDYYRAVDIHGVRLWVFRERAAPHAWFLHGVFG